MDLLKCPRCGEEYSPSYRRCPFCEEGDHPRKVKHNSGKHNSGKHNSGKQNGGRRVSDKKQTHSARGAMAAVLMLIFQDTILSLVASLQLGSNDMVRIGDWIEMIVAKINPDDADPLPGVQDDSNKPVDGETDADGEADPSIGEEPNVGDVTGGETTDPGTTAPVTPTVDASALSIKTNVGTTLSKDANGTFDCTIKPSESIRLSVSGTDAATTWALARHSCLCYNYLEEVFSGAIDYDDP